MLARRCGPDDDQIFFKKQASAEVVRKRSRWLGDHDRVEASIHELFQEDAAGSIPQTQLEKGMPLANHAHRGGKSGDLQAIDDAEVQAASEPARSLIGGIA